MMYKKRYKIFLVLTTLLLTLALTSCFEEEKPKPYKMGDETEVAKLNKGKKNEPLVIEERFFITQINDIYTNFNEYKDRTIKVEGMMGNLKDWQGSEEIPVVYRIGPGCCSNDGWGGFMLDYDGKYPKDKTWIEVTGKAYLKDSGEGYDYLFLKVKTLKKKSPRGAETVKR